MQTDDLPAVPPPSLCSACGGDGLEITPYHPMHRICHRCGGSGNHIGEVTDMVTEPNNDSKTIEFLQDIVEQDVEKASRQFNR